MSTATLERPGVRVTQEFATATATILRPTLQACVVGPCNQVIEAVQDDGTLNDDAQVTLPARITFPWVSTPFEYTGLGSDTLLLQVNNAATETITFDASPANPTVDQTLDQILDLEIVGLTGLIETSGTQKRVVLYTTNDGEFASIKVMSGTAIATLQTPDLRVGYLHEGSSVYNNYFFRRIQLADYPDPRSNLEDLVIDYDSIRVFFDTGGGGFQEVLRTESPLRGATAAVTTQDDADGDNLTPYLNFAGSPGFTTAAADASVTGSTDVTAGGLYGGGGTLHGTTLIMSLDGEPYQSLTFDGATSSASQVAMEAAINALWQVNGAAQVVADVPVTNLRIRSHNTNGGNESVIRIKDGSANAVLGLTSNSSTRGTPFPVAAGDAVYVDGVFAGNVTEVTTIARLRLDREVVLTFSGARYQIVAKGLDNSASTTTRPSSNLIVDSNTGTILIKHEILRDAANTPTAGNMRVLLAYTALRKDVSPAATAGFNLLRYGQLTDIAADLAPLDTQNPLGLGMYFAQLNAPGVEITGCGVDETSATEPEGTLDSYTRAFEFLESKAVYALAPLTHSLLVGQIADAHVTEMSDPDNGLERLVFLNPSRPTRDADTIVASGATGNTSGGVPTNDFDTGVATLPALLAALGLSSGSYDIDDALFLSLEDDTNNYLVTAVSGSVLTISTGAIVGNTDAFYFEGADFATTAIVDRPFSLKIRGGAVGTLTDEAVAYAALAQGFRNRRVFAVTPDKARASIDGLDTLIEGYYLCAAIAGRVSSKNPQDPLTEVSLTGFSGVQGSNDRYGELQLKIMDGGGLWTVYQEATGQPVRTRHQLATDMSTLEKRELSITTAIDFVAYIIRASYRNFVGRFNVTTNVIDAMGSAWQGIRAMLLESRVVKTLELNSMGPHETQPDRIVMNISVGPFYPLNNIDVTLVI